MPWGAADPAQWACIHDYYIIYQIGLCYITLYYIALDCCIASCDLLSNPDWGEKLLTLFRC